MQPPLPITTPRRSGAYTLLATREYLDQLIQDIAETTRGDRVLLATMDFNPTGFKINDLVRACCEAQKRGVTVTCFIDSHAFLIDPDGHIGPLWYGRMHKPTANKWFVDSQAGIKALREAGIHIVLTNPVSRPFTSPFAGRSHIKASIINTTVYVGGHNLSHQSLDCMVRTDNQQTADWLYTLLMKRAQEPTTLNAWGTKDITHQISPTTALHIDVGVSQQSLIYDEALRIIDQAQKHILITCQFFPRGKTADRLREAYARGVKVQIIFNGASHHAGIGQLVHGAVNLYERAQSPPEFFTSKLTTASNFLHAKVLASESEAMVGSHNYIIEGVNFGTAEIALHRKDAAFAASAIDLILDETQVKRSI